jgi:hypothetical protein
VTPLSHLGLVAVLAALAGAVTAWFVRHLRRRDRTTLRAKILALVAGLVCLEIATLPAILMALFAAEVFGLPESDFGPWIAFGVYGGLAVFVLVRLFPWREVESLAADPDVSLKDVLSKIRDGR